MKKIKTLPVTTAVIAALYSISAQAQEFTQEQIDAIVAKAVDKALAERQENGCRGSEKVDVINEPESAAQSPDMAIPFGVKFSGYARYGAHFQSGDQKYVAVDGSYNGASAIGRLGNEGMAESFSYQKPSRAITAQSGMSMS